MIEFMGWLVLVILIISTFVGIILMIKALVGMYQLNKEYDAMQKKYEKDQQEIIASIRKELAEFDKQFTE